MSRRHVIREFSQDRSGGALLAAAVILPLVLVMLYVAFELGRVFSTLSRAERDLRSATHYLASLPAAEVCGAGLVEARNLAVYGNTAGTGPRRLDGWTTADITLDQPRDCGGGAITLVRLRADLDYQALAWKATGLPGSLGFTIEQAERWQGD